MCPREGARERETRWKKKQNDNLNKEGGKKTLRRVRDSHLLFSLD